MTPPPAMAHTSLDMTPKCTLQMSGWKIGLMQGRSCQAWVKPEETIRVSLLSVWMPSAYSNQQPTRLLALTRNQEEEYHPTAQISPDLADRHLSQRQQATL